MYVYIYIDVLFFCFNHWAPTIIEMNTFSRFRCSTAAIHTHSRTHYRIKCLSVTFYSIRFRLFVVVVNVVLHFGTILQHLNMIVKKKQRKKRLAFFSHHRWFVFNAAGRNLICLHGNGAQRIRLFRFPRRRRRRRLVAKILLWILFLSKVKNVLASNLVR